MLLMKKEGGSICLRFKAFPDFLPSFNTLHLVLQDCPEKLSSKFSRMKKKWLLVGNRRDGLGRLLSGQPIL